jgi:hypothetical protein
MFAMKLERLISYFSSSPSAKLLRSPHAAHIVCILESQFKSSGSITNPHSLLQRLAEFQETIHQSNSDVLRDRPEIYLINWSTGDSRWLRRFHDVEHAESVYELTPHTEEVLKFLNDVIQRSLGFVGTESRLKPVD